MKIANKVWLLILLVLTLSIKVNAQDNYIGRTFEDLETKLYKSYIIKLDTMKRDELKNKFKNVASTLFVNLKEVMVSETDDQIVLNYLSTTNSTPTTTWYVKLIAQFKDGKVRLLIYDDGNLFIPSEQYTPTWPARSIYVTDNRRAQKKFRIKILEEWMDDKDRMIKKIENGLRNQDKIGDW